MLICWMREKGKQNRGIFCPDLERNRAPSGPNRETALRAGNAPQSGVGGSSDRLQLEQYSCDYSDKQKVYFMFLNAI